MRFGVVLPTSGVGDDPHTVIDLAVDAEAAGWDGVFIWDFPFVGPRFGRKVQMIHEAWALMAGMAMRTERILIGTMLTALAWRSPWLIAKQASTLQSLSGGRFVLSVGLGFPPPDGTYFYEETERRTRAAMLDEGLQIVEQLWTGKPLQFEGRFYRARNDPVMLPVAKPRPKVWVVGAWNRQAEAWPKKRSFRRALHWDGLLPQVFDGDETVMGAFRPDDIRAITKDIKRERKKPIDVIVEGGGKGDENAPPEVVRELADAGATWWNEAIWESMYRHRGDPAVLRERIRQGPPAI